MKSSLFLSGILLLLIVCRAAAVMDASVDTDELIDKLDRQARSEPSPDEQLQNEVDRRAAAEERIATLHALPPAAIKIWAQKAPDETLDPAELAASVATTATVETTADNEPIDTPPAPRRMRLLLATGVTAILGIAWFIQRRRTALAAAQTLQSSRSRPA